MAPHRTADAAADWAGPNMWFIRVPEPPTARNRMHFDLRAPETMASEVERLQAAGATVAGRFDGHTVMRDPEGNVFCVELGQLTSGLDGGDAAGPFRVVRPPLTTAACPPGSLTSMSKVELSEQEWRDRLSPEEYHVLREAGTEAPFTGEYTDTETKGVYRCRACGAELFRSNSKFHSGCGWPSFYQPTEDDAVILLEDRSLGRVRTEVRCASCNSHLGHVFEGEGYDVPTDQRWCINSVSLTLEEE